MVKTAVNSHWLLKLVEEAEAKKTLSLLNIERCSLDSLHPVWNDIDSPLDVAKATVKAKLLIQRYPLATSPTAGQQRSETCPLCKDEPETVSHFLLQCPSLQKERRIYLPRVLETYRKHSIPIDVNEITKIILDSNHLEQYDRAHEVTCRNMVYKLHHKRATLLGRESRYKSN